MGVMVVGQARTSPVYKPKSKFSSCIKTWRGRGRRRGRKMKFASRGWGKKRAGARRIIYAIIDVIAFEYSQLCASPELVTL